MDRDGVLAWLEAEGSAEEAAGLARFGIPTTRAFGIPMGRLRDFAKRVGSSHALAGELWATGWYEARTLAAFVDVPAEVTEAQMDAWAHDFDSWAICDTVCFHLFDRTPLAWDKAAAWADAPEEFVRRAGWALVWALSVHDKKAPDAPFLEALDRMTHAEPDPRPLVKKAVDMALRAVGKRNLRLHGEAVATAQGLAEDEDATLRWIGRHALRELESEKVAARLEAKARRRSS